MQPYYFCRFWPIIDDALKSAMYNNGIKVRVLGSIWKYSDPDMIKFLRSLQDVNGTGQFNGTLEVVSLSVVPIHATVDYIFLEAI